MGISTSSHEAAVTRPPVLQAERETVPPMNSINTASGSSSNPGLEKKKREGNECEPEISRRSIGVVNKEDQANSVDTSSNNNNNPSGTEQVKRKVEEHKPEVQPRRSGRIVKTLKEDGSVPIVTSSSDSISSNGTEQKKRKGDEYEPDTSIRRSTSSLKKLKTDDAAVAPAPATKSRKSSKSAKSEDAKK
ncbi:hypothetical protein LENED_001778 [Lentinula edodes]|uniref:Uncharacterized protein n=1 Tax=Lentinula edodes TaxID=5353 RepID=A0A1Q3DZI5_LENED|nr:hypothetical protein LENED_001778 [Lentinula edodes]